MPLPRIALFTLEALPSASAVRRFIAAHSAQIAFVGLSNAMRPSCGGLAGQVRRHLRRSGPRILPYLAVNFAIPDLVRAVDPVVIRLRRSSSDASTPLKALCRTLDIPAVRVDDVNGAEMAAAFAEHRPDLIVTFHFDQILSAETLARAPLGGLNVHPGLLPLHRGPVPTVHALAEDPPAFGVTVHRLVETIDAGPILAQARVAMPPGCSASRAAILLHERGRLLLDDALAAVAERGMPDGTSVEPRAYCPFPSAAVLRDMRRRKRRLTDWQDLREAIGLGRTR